MNVNFGNINPGFKVESISGQKPVAQQEKPMEVRVDLT